MRLGKSALAAQLLLALAFAGTATAASKGAQRQIERGRYLVRITGCNDCHTAGYAQSGGKVPAGEWLTGSTVGFQGPWGTTYPANLRLLAQSLDETQWMARARSTLRPPMPWFALRDMSDADLRAMYRFVRSLGAKGAPAPAYAPPGQPVATPYIEFAPKNLPARGAH